MQFKIKTKKFFEIIKKINKIMNNTTTLDRYRYLIIKIDDDKINFCARNERIELQAIISDKNIIDISKTGSIVLNTKIINDIFAKTKDEWVYFEKRLNQVLISNKNITNNFIFKLNLLENTDFELLTDIINKIDPIIIPANTISNYANQIAFTINPNSPNNNFNGASFLFSDKELIITGTDMYSLAQIAIPIVNKAKLNKEIIIPGAVLNDLEKIFIDNTNPLTFCLPNDNFFYINDDVFFIKGSLLANNAYFINKNQNINTKNILTLIKNNEPENKIIINSVKNFLNIIQLAIILTKKDLIPLVAFSFDFCNKVIKIDCFSNDNEWGTAEKQFHEIVFQEIINKDKAFQVIFNYVLLVNALKAFLHCDKITMTILEHSNRTIITSAEDKTIIQLVLPYKK